MNFVVADFQAAFPELRTVTQAKITFWERQAFLHLNADRFEGRLDRAVMLFVAHHIVAGAGSYYSGTPYGRRLLEVMRLDERGLSDLSADGQFHGSTERAASAASASCRDAN